MNIFKRIAVTVTGGVDSLVSHVENHDALVDAALGETRSASAKAKIRLVRIQKDAANLRQKIQELQASEAAWEQRAVANAEKDQATALQCVKRRNQCKAQIAQNNAALTRLSDVEREVGASVERIENRITELSQQRNMLRSRHSAADALRVINKIEGGSSYGIDDIFDRWEMRITETEYETGSVKHTDSLETAFLQQENEETLKADLAALLQGSTASDKE